MSVVQPAYCVHPHGWRLTATPAARSFPGCTSRVRVRVRSAAHSHPQTHCDVADWCLWLRRWHSSRVHGILPAAGQAQCGHSHRHSQQGHSCDLAESGYVAALMEPGWSSAPGSPLTAQCVSCTCAPHSLVVYVFIVQDADVQHAQSDTACDACDQAHGGQCIACALQRILCMPSVVDGCAVEGSWWGSS